MSWRGHLVDVEAMQRFAQFFAAQLVYPLQCYLEGEIGAGKTTFVRCVLRALGVNERIKSPTFSLVEHYRVDQLSIIHADFYRLGSPEAVDEIGFAELVAGSQLVMLEWPYPELALAKPDLACQLLEPAAGGRLFDCYAHSKQGQRLVDRLMHFDLGQA